METELTAISIHTIGLDDLKRNWKRFVLLGVLLLVLGTIAVTSSILFTIASILLFGGFMVVAGILQIAHALASKRWGGHFMDLLIGMLNLVVGLLIVANPGAAAAAVTLMIALFLILGGLFRLALAVTTPFHHVFWLAVHGAVSLLLGFLILQQWPVSGLWVIGLFIGIDMALSGWTLVMLGLIARKLNALRGHSCLVAADDQHDEQCSRLHLKSLLDGLGVMRLGE